MVSRCRTLFHDRCIKKLTKDRARRPIEAMRSSTSRSTTSDDPDDDADEPEAEAAGTDLQDVAVGDCIFLVQRSPDGSGNELWVAEVKAIRVRAGKLFRYTATAHAQSVFDVVVQYFTPVVKSRLDRWYQLEFGTNFWLRWIPSADIVAGKAELTHRDGSDDDFYTMDVDDQKLLKKLAAENVSPVGYFYKSPSAASANTGFSPL
eukprot:TRINITY_DN27687_c0_g1_i1.p1 TRINITY_DN27687_c0_g1~~TRINITY_DN27687_c0_g1_i1.p1  ORF type:complete len:205 (+),score=6.29 TRINITY_DN27687_c0_g1_i1:340-954(+)